jgi:hypothetical protein
MKYYFFGWLVLSGFMVQAQQQYDVCVYGGTSGGVIAAYTAKKMGKSVLLVEPGKHVGGLSSGGLGYTDIGNKFAVTGLGLDFYRRTGKYYNKFESWIFEPSVAENIFNEYLSEAKVTVLYQNRIIAATKKDGIIKEITLENVSVSPVKNTSIKAKIFIDCSYEGDLMAKAAVSYTVGRESASKYNESYNGVQVQPPATPQHGNQIPDGVDPYKIPGDPSSGLLWGISDATLPPVGTGDHRVQAYNFRICLTSDPDNRIPITKPADYDASMYELLPRYIARLVTPGDIREILKFDIMPNNKTDINNGGGFSTDMIGENWHYPDADYATREKFYRKLKNYNQGLLYFIGHDPRIPDSVRNFMLNWGYPKDEYKDNDHWSPQIYVREARRMIGEYVMTQANCERREIVKDGIGMAAYGMDSHNTQRLVINGMAKNEGDVEKGGAGPYPVSYRSLTPKITECKNLLVPVCLSASHIGYGSIRMEPVFMVLGQSAGIAAAMAINNKVPVQKVDVSKIQALLRSNPLMNNATPEILVDNDDSLNIIKTGAWSLKKGGTYGATAFYSAVNKEPKSVQFFAPVQKAGDYDVYVYQLPKINKASSSSTFIVHNGMAEKEVIIRNEHINVAGQTSGEWVHLGKYAIAVNKKVSVTISNKGADGTIVADAVLWVPAGKK